MAETVGKSEATSRSMEDVKTKVVATARAWAAGRDHDLDLDDPDVDGALDAVQARIASIVGPKRFPAFISDMRRRAGAVTSVGGANGHSLDRDLILVPAVGPPGDVDLLAADADRTRDLAEILRRSGMLTRPEEVLILPVVLDVAALAAPTLRGIRRTVRLVAASMDAEDVYDAEQSNAMAREVADLLGARVAGMPRSGASSASPSIHALVGVASCRRTAREDAIPLVVMDTASEVVRMLEAMETVSGRRVKLGGPGDWGATSAAAACEFVDLSLRTRRLMAGISSWTPVDEIRRSRSRDGRDELLSFVLDGRTVGPVAVPASLAEQNAMFFDRSLRGYGAPIRGCTPDELAAPPSPEPDSVWRPKG